MSNPGFNRQWAKHIDAVWGAQQRRGPGGFAGSGHGEHRGHGGPPGPPPWLAGLFGLGQGEQPRGPRVRRGDVRSAVLDVVRDAGERGEGINGYQVIQQIAERSHQEWRPSPGSVYPTISQLEDEGLLETDETAGRRALRLTASGQAYVAENADALAAVWAPFRAQEEEGAGRTGRPFADLKPEIGQVMSAVWQIVTSGSEAQRAAAVDVLVETRRSLYGILAEGDPVDPVDESSEDPTDPIVPGSAR